MSVTYHIDLLIAARQAIINSIDAAGEGASINLFNVSNELLSTIPLKYPSATLDTETGKITFLPDSIDMASELAPTDRIASKAIIRDAATPQKDWIIATCVEGSSPVTNTCVITSLTVEAGQPVKALLITIG